MSTHDDVHAEAMGDWMAAGFDYDGPDAADFLDLEDARTAAERAADAEWWASLGYSEASEAGQLQSIEAAA